MNKIKIQRAAYLALEAFEVVLAEKPEGATVREVWEVLGGCGLSTFFGRTASLCSLGLLRMTGLKTSKKNKYVFSEDYLEIRDALVVNSVRGRAPKGKPSSPPSKHLPRKEATTKAQDLPLLNGLPFIPSDELRQHLGKVVEALENLKEHVGPLLALLLDLDRDYDRFTAVTRGLVTLKNQLEGVRIQ